MKQVMKRLGTSARRLRRDTNGAGMTEYIILVGVIAILGMAAFQSFGGTIKAKIEAFTGQLSGMGE